MVQSSKSRKRRKQLPPSSEDGSEIDEGSQGDTEAAHYQQVANEAQLRALRAEQTAARQEEQIRVLNQRIMIQERNHEEPEPREARSNGIADPIRNQPEVAQQAHGRTGEVALNTHRPQPDTTVELEVARRALNSLLAKEHNKELIRTAGRRCCVLHHPFMETDFLTDTSVQRGLPKIIQDLKNKNAGPTTDENNSEDDDYDGNEDFWATPHFTLAEPVEIVREVLSELPVELGEHWLDPAFQKLFRYGYRKMRSEAATSIANARAVVFKMTDDDFGNRSKDRHRGPGAKALFDNNAYMFLPPEGTDDHPLPAYQRIFRHSCLISACQVLMSGLSAAEDPADQASTKARSSRGAMWKVKSITPSILAFNSLVVHFVLSGEKEFLKMTPSTNYASLFDDRMGLLKVHYERKRSAYKEMEEIYNSKVFPAYHRPQDMGDFAALSEQEQALRAELLEDD